MPIAPIDVPNYLVLEPRGGLRLDVRLPTGACVISAALENPAPGRNFILMAGAPSEPFAERARIAGRATLHFEPGRPGLYIVLLTNPMHEPAVIRLRMRPIVLGSEAHRAKAPTRKKARNRR